MSAPNRTYFDVLRSISTDPDVLAAAAAVEAAEIHREWKQRVGWLGVTHHWPYRLLPGWRWLFCRYGWHLFDEVYSGGPDGAHCLSCDACDLEVHISQRPASPVGGEQQ